MDAPNEYPVADPERDEPAASAEDVTTPADTAAGDADALSDPNHSTALPSGEDAAPADPESPPGGTGPGDAEPEAMEAPAATEEPERLAEREEPESPPEEHSVEAAEVGTEAGAEQESTSGEGGEAEPEVRRDEGAGVSPEPLSMMELLMEEGDYLPESHQRGDVVTGTVLRKDSDQLILDIGAKQEGIVPSSDLLRLPPEVVAGISVGDQIEAVVLRPEGREGGVLVSVSQAVAMADWKKANELMDSGDILELEIVGHNKGGALVGFHNLQGFVPRSHLVRLASVNEPDAVMQGLSDLIGEMIPVKVIEVSRRKRRLIMSERLAVREWRSDQKKRLLEQLAEGEIRRGRVSSVADFGVFVDLGGADGLVHVSELTHERGRHPKDVVKVGQEVDVYILSIDRDRKRIGLSMKRLQSDPWETVDEEHYVGELVEATISNLAKFGAFARMDDGIEGLIHISELSDGHIEHPREAVRPGQRVTVEIIAIEPSRQRVGLSIRRVPKHLRTVHEPTEEAEAEETIAEEIVAEETIADETVAEEIVAEEPAAEETVAEEIVAEEAAAEETVAEEIVAEEPAAEETAAEEFVAEASVVEGTSEAAIAEETVGEVAVAGDVLEAVEEQADRDGEPEAGGPTGPEVSDTEDGAPVAEAQAGEGGEGAAGEATVPAEAEDADASEDVAPAKGRDVAKPEDASPPVDVGSTEVDGEVAADGQDVGEEDVRA